MIAVGKRKYVSNGNKAKTLRAATLRVFYSLFGMADLDHRLTTSYFRLSSHLQM